MRLQLDSLNLTPPDSGRVASAGSAGAASASRTAYANNAGNDSIGISGTSLALNGISAERSSRIQQLTAAVQAGTYNVSGSAISRAIMAQATVQ